jgi:hypothetical protein
MELHDVFQIIFETAKTVLALIGVGSIAVMGYILLIIHKN